MGKINFVNLMKHVGVYASMIVGIGIVLFGTWVMFMASPERDWIPIGAVVVFSGSCLFRVGATYFVYPDLVKHWVIKQ